MFYLFLFASCNDLITSQWAHLIPSLSFSQTPPKPNSLNISCQNFGNLLYSCMFIHGTLLIILILLKSISALSTHKFHLKALTWSAFFCTSLIVLHILNVPTDGPHSLSSFLPISCPCLPNSYNEYLLQRFGDLKVF